MNYETDKTTAEMASLPVILQVNRSKQIQDNIGLFENQVTGVRFKQSAEHLSQNHVPNIDARVKNHSIHSARASRVLR